MRLVFDANVLISALLFNTSIPGKALLKAKANSATFLISSETFRELLEVLMRPKFDKYVSQGIRQAFIEEFISLSTKIDATQRVTLCRDPKDNMYLELALSAQADFIITDDDLLALHPFENTSIITPLDFLNKDALV